MATIGTTSSTPVKASFVERGLEVPVGVRDSCGETLGECEGVIVGVVVDVPDGTITGGDVVSTGGVVAVVDVELVSVSVMVGLTVVVVDSAVVVRTVVVVEGGTVSVVVVKQWSSLTPPSFPCSSQS